jgi:hypothetical protein
MSSSVLFYRTGELQKSGRCEAGARPKLTFKKLTICKFSIDVDLPICFNLHISDFQKGDGNGKSRICAGEFEHSGLSGAG